MTTPLEEQARELGLEIIEDEIYLLKDGKREFIEGGFETHSAIEAYIEFARIIHNSAIEKAAELLSTNEFERDLIDLPKQAIAGAIRSLSITSNGEGGAEIHHSGI